jgi:hypothetical protein
MGCADAGSFGPEGSVVTVEASGQAGIFQWVALASTGADALLVWLNDNNFDVPSATSEIIDHYIQQEMHFLAMRVSEPDQVQENSAGEIEIPPIQFTCQTSQRFYPMAISRISAAGSAEVLVYILAEHRAEAANIANSVISDDDLRYAPDSPSLTNYETLFAQEVSELGGRALITECAYRETYYSGQELWFWPEAPATITANTPNGMFLTRLRTVIARDQMTVDFQFRDASSDEPVYEVHDVDAQSQIITASMNLAAATLFPGLLLAAFRRCFVRRIAE